MSQSEIVMKMKSANEYYKDIYTMSINDLIKRLAGLLDDIINDWNIDVNDTSDAAVIHESIISSIKMVAVYFSSIYQDIPIPFSVTVGRRVATIESIVKKIEDVADCLQIVQFITSAISRADYADIHDENINPSERAIVRSGKLFNRLQPVSSFLYMIEDVARNWLKQRELK